LGTDHCFCAWWPPPPSRTSPWPSLLFPFTKSHAPRSRFVCSNFDLCYPCRFPLNPIPFHPPPLPSPYPKETLHEATAPSSAFPTRIFCCLVLVWSASSAIHSAPPGELVTFPSTAVFLPFAKSLMVVSFQSFSVGHPDPSRFCHFPCL